MLHKDRIDKANAIAQRVRKHKGDFNSVSFKGLSSRGGAKELWDKVKVVTGKSRVQAIQTYFIAEQLNLHYAAHSTDLNYVVSNTKVTVPMYNASNRICEFVIFNMLDRLKATAQGPYGLPYWL